MNYRRAVRISIIFILSIFAAGAAARAVSTPPTAGEDALLDAIFRIDLKTVQASLTFNPADNSVDGTCTMYFRMRPGQIRPVFHFKPLATGELTAYTFRLDGETWDVAAANTAAGSAILKVLALPGTAQKSIEVERDVDPSLDHVMSLTYHILLSPGYPRFSSLVDDIAGQGNEAVFPTLNTPGELARHILTFRVSGAAPYRCIGSGWVQKTGAQEWQLDTEREVASYTVMYALLPEADTVYEERIINGIPVRLLAYVGGASVSQAWTQITGALVDFVIWYGTFPMPRGLSVFLVGGGGGMEYFGGTISGVGALRHEIHHMYFATSTVAKTYRDSWFDEAVTSWAVDYARNIAPIAANYRSNIVSGRTPWAIGFDTRAYNKGAQIFGALAAKAGSSANLTLFLSNLYRKHAFAPFTTLDLAEYFKEFTGIDVRPDFLNWLYNGKAPAFSESTAAGSVASDFVGKAALARDLFPRASTAEVDPRAGSGAPAGVGVRAGAPAIKDDLVDSLVKDELVVADVEAAVDPTPPDPILRKYGLSTVSSATPSRRLP